MRGEHLGDVTEAPEIAPLSEQTHYLRGSRLYLTCLATRGDGPLRFRWLRDGAPLSGAETGVVTRTLDDFSTALTFAALQPAHSGNYTCELSNDAAVATRSAQVVVTGGSHSEKEVWQKCLDDVECN